MSLRRRHVTGVAAALVAVSWLTSTAGADVLRFRSGNADVAVTAVGPSVFRVSVNARGRAEPLNSQFIDPARHPGDVGRAVSANGHSRLVTATAAVDVEPAAGTLSLLTADGTVLLPPAPVRAGSGPSLSLGVGWPADRPFRVYGCGNGADSLVQSAVRSRVGNGIAVQPFFWSPTGFATFVVGADDDAPAQCDGQVRDGRLTWAVPGSAADLYLIAAPSLSAACRSLLELTGRPPVPPRWAFGYLQSRWGWKSPDYITDTLRQFTARRLPVDAFIFDFEWYTATPDYRVPPDGVAGFTDFGWNPGLFPRPAEQVRQLHDAGIHVVGIRKPRLGDSASLAEVRRHGWVLPAGKGFEARDLKFADPRLRAWYAARTEPLLRAGIDGWWDDEGELTYTDYLYWNLAERQALDAVRPTDRLWTINRAFQPGTSRLGAAAWTGDIHSSWRDLARTPTALLNWSLAGMPYGGCDIGGFSGQVTPKLLVRWMQAGTFFPVMRAHSELNACPHFPWLFGPDAEGAIRNALDLRYRLIPYLYSLGHALHDGGDPIMRPLAMQYPADPVVADRSDEWLIGADLLAAPVLTESDRRTVYLPDDLWYDFATGQRVAGGRSFDVDVPFDGVPLFVRGGAVLPMAPAGLQHTRDLPGGPLEVMVYPGRDGRFTLVEDDGSSTAYLAGDARRTTFTWDDARRTLSWHQDGRYEGTDRFRTFRVRVADRSTEPTDRPTQPLTADGSVTVGR